jgi:hypothetical protein
MTLLKWSLRVHWYRIMGKWETLCMLIMTIREIKGPLSNLRTPWISWEDNTRDQEAPEKAPVSNMEVDNHQIYKTCLLTSLRFLIDLLVLSTLTINRV